ncbi:MAG: Fic family protein [Candidatus Micrarchaeota archaeon]
MVTIKKKLIGTREYYYLQHTVRTKKGVQTKEKYIGTQIPRNIEKLRRDFLTQIYKERWYPVLDKIRANYSEERHKIPKSAFEKHIRTFSVKFTYDTSRIEGSKLTYRETADLLERGLTPRAKPLDDIKEAEAHEKVFYDMLECEKELSLQLVLRWHEKLFGETKRDIAGIVREHQVAISGSRFMPPSPIEVQPMLREFFRWYNKNREKLHPVEFAASVHLKFVTIHPFADGNGRMSRLLMNFVLQKHGFPLLNIPYENRGSYYSALERSQVKKNDSIFIQWFFKRYVKERKSYAGDRRQTLG